jgi:hypothetical protein
MSVNDQPSIADTSPQNRGNSVVKEGTREIVIEELASPRFHDLFHDFIDVSAGRMRAVKFGVLLMCLCATGCVSWVSHDYDVEGQGEKSASGGCSSSTEARLTRQLTPATSVVFWGSDDRLRPNHRIISISFTLSDDESVSLTKPEVLISSKAYSIPRVVPISTVRRSSVLVSPSCDAPADAAYQKPDEPMHRMPGISNGDPVTDSIFIVDVAVSGDPAQITIQLPPVSINGTLVDVPAVSFLHKTNVYLPGDRVVTLPNK